MRVWMLSFLVTATLCAAPLGEMFFEGNCVTCHHPTKAISAPSALEIQAQYQATFDTKEAFVAFMVEWIQDPKEVTALMPKAIEQYEIMPNNLGYDRVTLEEIATYLYDARFETP